MFEDTQQLSGLHTATLPHLHIHKKAHHVYDSTHTPVVLMIVPYRSSAE